LHAPSKAPWPLLALLGDNGSGKTTILQAIALTLSMATRRTYRMETFNWHGFLANRVHSLGKTLVELDITFEQEEISLTRALFEAWFESLPPEKRHQNYATPSDLSEVTLRLENGRVTSPQGAGALFQFLGRYYVKALKGTRPELKDNFAKLGDVFWFDQHRNLGSVMLELTPDSSSQNEGWQAGVEQLREYLIGWWAHHATPQRRGKDYIALLETCFQRVFPGRRFVGIMPRSEDAVHKASDFYFLIEHEGIVYDLAEMSSGEQSIFPLIYEFVRLDIQRSIVLIDELELHLHPPEQQRLLAALPKIGPDCQFLITTHSEYLSSVIPNEQEVRLDRGTRCL